MNDGDKLILFATATLFLFFITNLAIFSETFPLGIILQFTALIFYFPFGYPLQSP